MKYREFLPEILLISLFLRYLVTGFDLSSCISLGILSALVGYYKYISKKYYLEELKTDLKVIKEEQKKQEVFIDKLSTSLTGIKMTGNIKTTKF